MLGIYYEPAAWIYSSPKTEPIFQHQQRRNHIPFYQHVEVDRHDYAAPLREILPRRAVATQSSKLARQVLISRFPLP